MATEYHLACSAIDYRSGLIEIVPDIHPGCVNIEAWEIVGWSSIEGMSKEEFFEKSDEGEIELHSHIELEMTVEQARNLANALLTAAHEAENSANPAADDAQA